MNDLVSAPESQTAPAISTIGSEGVHEFIRYGFASATALSVDAGLIWFMTDFAGIPYLLSGGISFVVGLLVVYFLSVYWVFAKRAVQSRAAEFLIFTIIGLIGLGFNEAILYLGTSIFGFYYLISKIASVIVVFTWNFAARKWLLFRPHHA